MRKKEKTGEMKNSEKIILDLCGGTGSWSKPYRDAGYDVRVITLPEFDVIKIKLGDDGVLEFPYNDPKKLWPMLIGAKAVYGIVAAPPCTMFSRARTTAKDPRDFDGAMRIVRKCLEVIWYCRAKGNLKFWALENPMGYLRQFLGNPPYWFQPWWFGDRHFKFTDLWGYFNEPRKLRGAKAPKEFDRKKWASPKCPEEFRHLKLDRAGIRAITPKGFAKAFYKANR